MKSRIGNIIDFLKLMPVVHYYSNKMFVTLLFVKYHLHSLHVLLGRHGRGYQDALCHK